MEWTYAFSPYLSPRESMKKQELAPASFCALCPWGRAWTADGRHGLFIGSPMVHFYSRWTVCLLQSANFINKFHPPTHLEETKVLQEFLRMNSVYVTHAPSPAPNKQTTAKPKPRSAYSWFYLETESTYLTCFVSLKKNIEYSVIWYLEWSKVEPSGSRWPTSVFCLCPWLQVCTSAQMSVSSLSSDNV